MRCCCVHVLTAAASCVPAAPKLVPLVCQLNKYGTLELGGIGWQGYEVGPQAAPLGCKECWVVLEP
jgi:hypothetical protein